MLSLKQRCLEHFLKWEDFYLRGSGGGEHGGSSGGAGSGSGGGEGMKVVFQWAKMDLIKG